MTTVPFLCSAHQPFGIWLPCVARDSSYTCKDGPCPAEGLSGPMEWISIVDHSVFPSLIWRGGALAGWSNCNFNLHWRHFVRMVPQVFLFRGQPLLCEAKQSASLPLCPNFWWYHSPSRYCSWFEESLISISPILVNSSTFQFQFVAGLLSWTWALSHPILCGVFLAIFNNLPNLRSPGGRFICFPI